MVGELRRSEYMAQVVVAWEIEERFGKRWIYTNANGNPAIAKPVLAAFDALTGDGVVWENRERLWRYRQDYDLPSRRQP
jgi:hypothetical protein